jgi:thiol-disulfide isomerase/thioredoxin
MTSLLIGLLLLQATPPAENREATWLAKFQEALQLSQKSGKPLVIDAWRETCPNCKAMHARVHPVPAVAAILTAKFVCLKVDVDNPGPAEKFLSQVKGDTLPFYAYVSPDGKFISGTSGFRSEKTFLADLQGVIGSDALKVAPELDKRLAKMADQAAKDLEANKIPAVLKAAHEADAIRGFSETKDRINELKNQALEMGKKKLGEAAQLCADGKFDESGAALSSLIRDFKGSDVERSASVASKSLDRFKAASKESDAKAAKRLYEMILKDCKDATPFWDLAKEKLNN